jgi:hypothetical protein
MLERLSADVYPAYADLAKSGFNFNEILWNSRLSPHNMLPEAGKKELKRDKKTGSVYFDYYSPKLKIELIRWANSFHADQCGWFLDDTLRTLRGWYVAPEWRKSLRWNPHSGIASTLAIGERFLFDYPGWEMQTFTWAYYSQKLREAFEGKLSEYEKASRKIAESKGLVRARQKYSLANFEWFVLRRFAGLTSGEIVKRVSAENPDATDESTVLKGVKAAAKLMAWDHPRTRPKPSSRKI